MVKVEENAKNLNISVDSSLSMDAFDWAKKQDKKSSKKVKDYDYYIKKISNDKEWVLLLDKEAKERNISIDSVLSETARSWGKK